MADPPRPASTPPPPPKAVPPAAAAASGESVLEVIERLGGTAPKIVLRDVPSAHGATPIVVAGSTEARLAPAGRGNYDFHGEIARGGMGVILKGRDRDLGRDVAVKVLKKELAREPTIVARFVEEAQITGQLQHPGIVPIFELGLLADDRPYFTMKLVKGRTLAALLAERSAPDAERARLLAIFEQVCQTLAYAHSKGVIHRDLKPANVMVGAFGEVQLLDWGLAKVLAQGGVADEKKQRQDASQHSVIATVRSPRGPGSSGSGGSDSLVGSVVGTPAYMPPEQARGEIDRLDERSDVFSLGALLCEILTGRAPYVGDSDELMSRAAGAELGDATARLDGCGADPELIALAHRCLAPAPSARPRHAGVVAEAVGKWRTSLDERARCAEVAAAESRVKVQDERRARKLTLALAGAAVVILLLGGGGFAWFAWQRQTWQAQTAARVEAALDEAKLARGRERFDEAEAAIQQAVALLDAGRPTDELRQRVRDESSVVATAAAAAREQSKLERENRDLLAELSELGALGFEPSEFASIDHAFGDTFSAFGLELDNLGVAEAAAAIGRRGIGVPAAAVLDDWAAVRADLELEDDAYHLMKIAEEVDPDPTRRRLRAAIRIGDQDLLKEFFRREDLTTLPPASLCLLAHALLKSGEPRRARSVLRLARLVHPDSFDVCAWLMGQLEEGTLAEIEEAVQCGVAAIALRPDHALMHAAVGGLLIRPLGTPARGLALLDRAVELDPDNVRVRIRYGWARIDLGDYRGAVDQFREAVRCEPERATAHEALAVALCYCGDLDAAIAAADEAVRLDGRSEPARVVQIRARIAAGDLEGATAAFAAYQASRPQRVTTARWVLAELLAAGGERGGAAQKIDEAMNATDRNEPLALVLSAESLLNLADPTLRGPAHAAEFMREAVALAPRFIWCNELLGVALYRLGDWNGAIAALERSIEYAGGITADRAFHLAMACERVGRHGRALELLQAGRDWLEQQQNRHPRLAALREEAAQLIEGK